MALPQDPMPQSSFQIDKPEIINDGSKLSTHVRQEHAAAGPPSDVDRAHHGMSPSPRT